METLFLSLSLFLSFFSLFSFERVSHIAAQAHVLFLPHSYPFSVNNYIKMTLKMADDWPAPG